MGLPCRVRVNYRCYAVAVHRRLCYPHVSPIRLLPIEFKLLLRVAKLTRSSLSLSEITKEVSEYIEVYKGCPST